MIRLKVLILFILIISIGCVPHETKDKYASIGHESTFVMIEGIYLGEERNYDKIHELFVRKFKKKKIYSDLLYLDIYNKNVSFAIQDRGKCSSKVCLSNLLRQILEIVSYNDYSLQSYFLFEGESNEIFSKLNTKNQAYECAFKVDFGPNGYDESKNFNSIIFDRKTSYKLPIFIHSSISSKTKYTSLKNEYSYSNSVDILFFKNCSSKKEYLDWMLRSYNIKEFKITKFNSMIELAKVFPDFK